MGAGRWNVAPGTTAEGRTIATDGHYDWAVVFADVVGSTPLFERMGDRAAQALISDLLLSLVGVAEEGGGEAIQIAGDEVICRFDEADAAAAAALRMHDEAEAFGAARGQRMSIRIGVNFGRVLIERGRVFGDAVNVAARLAGIARSRQTILGPPLVERLGAEFRGRVRRFGEVPLKGKRAPVVVHDLPLPETRLTALRTQPAATGDASQARLTLYHGSRAAVLDAAADAFSVGRGAENALVVEGECVSRTHAEIRRVGDKFVLEDVSTNGTWVEFADGQTVSLRRESLPLWGSGRIGLGHPVDPATSLRFDCSNGA